MSDKQTMTLNLKEAEMEVLKELTQSKDVTMTAIIRKAIRLHNWLNFESKP